MEYNSRKEEYAGSDRRRSPRLRACIVEYSSGEKDNARELTFTENISAGGICIFVADNFKLGTPLSLRIFIPYYQQPLQAKGRIVWRNESLFMGKRGVENYDIGIEFTQIAEEDRRNIASYIRKYSKRRKGREEIDIIS